jgi:hypothetical protein
MQQGRQVPRAAAVAGRPNSTRAQGSADPSPKKKAPRVPPKLSFGNPVAPEKKKQAAVALPNRRSDQDNVKRRDFPSDSKPARGKVEFSDGPSNGFAKLQSAAKAAPIVVTYEDEGQYSVRGKGRGGNSMELQSESEYLHIGKSGGDVIGGDQLDRLLVQARRARVAAT